MTDTDILAILRLQNAPNIGDVTAKKLISHCGSPAAVFTDKLHQLQKIDGIGSFTIRGLHDAEHREKPETIAYEDEHGPHSRRTRPRSG